MTKKEIALLFPYLDPKTHRSHPNQPLTTTIIETKPPRAPPANRGMIF